MKRVAFTGVVGGLIGALVFWWYQTTFQNAAITDFIGRQIVSQGNYSLPAPLVGWAVHLGVSFSYAVFMAIVALVLFPASVFLNRVASLVAALVLGLITTLIAPPAIQITIALLSGKGLPSSLWGLNTSGGHALWNHLIFFLVVWVVNTFYLGVMEKRR